MIWGQVGQDRTREGKTGRSLEPFLTYLEHSKNIIFGICGKVRIQALIWR